MSREAEIRNRLSIALTTTQRLRLFWRHSSVPIKWKLQVYNAVVTAQLTYGMNVIYLTDSLINKLDAFQLRGLRAMLDIDHAYWFRISNEEVFARANKEMNTNRGTETMEWHHFQGQHQHKQHIRNISEIIQDRQVTLLGHILRLDDKAPEKKRSCLTNHSTETSQTRKEWASHEPIGPGKPQKKHSKEQRKKAK